MVIVSRRRFIKGVVVAAAATIVAATLPVGMRVAEAATLTVDSLSLTPQVNWPVDATYGILASQSPENTIKLAAAGASVLPSSSTAGTWSGTPTVQTDFSP